MSNFKIGDIVKGQVTGVTKYGVFVSLEDDYSGLVHISEVSNKFVKDLKEKFMIGDIINVQILEICELKSHVKLSIKKIKYKVETKDNISHIEEMGCGFELLEKELPIWTQDKIKEMSEKVK